jgi:hypothetical protein
MLGQWNAGYIRLALYPEVAQKSLLCLGSDFEPMAPSAHPSHGGIMKVSRARKPGKIMVIQYSWETGFQNRTGKYRQ